VPIFFELLLCAAVIFYSAEQLTRHGDVLAEKLKLSRSWIGIVLLASFTSLPELSNSLSAVTYVGEPDLGAGNLLGACLINLLLIAFMDYLYHDRPIFNKLDPGHILSAAFGILLLSLTCLGILFSAKINGHLIALMILLVYLIGQRLIFIFEKGKIIELEKFYEKEKLNQAIIKFLFFGLLVVISGIWLSTLGNKLALETGWGATFVGSLILSFITTLPELTVSYSALRLGAPDMAIGNLLGSVLFNVAILSIIDPFCRKTPLFSAISGLNILTALAGIICLSLVIIGVVKHSEKKLFLRFSWNSVLIILTVIGSYYLLFTIKRV
jgi:cation:H+ antiporter